MNQAIEIIREFGPEGQQALAGARDSLISMKKSMEGSFGALADLQHLIAGLPPATTEFARARRRTANTVSEVLSAWNSILALVVQLLALIDDIESPDTTGRGRARSAGRVEPRRRPKG